MATRAARESIEQEEIVAVATVDFAAERREDVLRSLAESLASTADGVTPTEVERSLAEREQLGSTRVAEGVSMPHCRCNGVRRPALAILRTRVPLPSDVDDGTEQLFLGVVTPEGAPAEHLRVLASLSRRVRERGRLDALFAAPTAEAMLRAWTRPEGAAA